MEQINELLVGINAQQRVLIFGLIILVNALMGAAYALKDGKFTPDEWSKIFDEKLVRLGLAFLGVNVTGATIDNLGGDIIAGGGSVIATLPFVYSTIKYFIKLFGGSSPKVLGGSPT